MVKASFAMGVALLAATAACGSDGGGTTGDTAVKVLFSVPRGGQPLPEFFQLPFPNDIRMKGARGVDLTGFPATSQLAGFVRELVAADTTGASLNGATYFRFSGEIDPTTLPPAEGPAPADASVFMVNIDPASPEHGKRAVLKMKYDPLALDYIGDNALSVLVYPGFPLREGVKYAAVVTTRVKSKAGKAVTRDADLDALLGAVPPADADLAAAWAKYAPLREYVASGALAAGDIAGATVFTTQHATGLMAEIRKVVYRDFPPPPAVTDMTKIGETDQYVAFEGRMDGPNFQSGTAPYQMPSDGGAIEFDAAGDPKINHTESIRFAVTIPKGEMPLEGWPVALYAHGTGGDYKSFIGDSIGSDLAEIKDGQGAVIAKIACISIDQVLHGPRLNSTVASIELSFFNFVNPAAFRDNIKQGALDDFQLVRFVEVLDMSSGVTRIKFDPKKIYFSGHSQGGLTGPLFLAAEPKIKAAILSGAGGVAVLSLLEKKEPFDVKGTVKLLVNDAVVDAYHPLLTLVQGYMESSDPINYARLITYEPPAGMAPKHVFQTLGVVDNYTPIETIKALAIALHSNPVMPLPEPLPGMVLAGLEPMNAEVSMNLTVGTTKITATLTEYIAPAGQYDGHFVVFHDPRGIRQAKNFLGTMAVTGIPKVIN